MVGEAWTVTIRDTIKATGEAAKLAALNVLDFAVLIYSRIWRLMIVLKPLGKSG